MASITPTTRTWCALQQAVQSGEYSDYQQYAELVNNRPAATLRDLLALNPGDEAVSIDDAEPASELFKRFDTAAMSIGALSPEAHEALAEAMNSIGGNSNSGEAVKILPATAPIKCPVSSRWHLVALA